MPLLYRFTVADCRAPNPIPDAPEDFWRELRFVSITPTDLAPYSEPRCVFRFTDSVVNRDSRPDEPSVYRDGDTEVTIMGVRRAGVQVPFRTWGQGSPVIMTETGIASGYRFDVWETVLPDWDHEARAAINEFWWQLAVSEGRDQTLHVTSIAVAAL